MLRLCGRSQLGGRRAAGFSHFKFLSGSPCRDDFLWSKAFSLQQASQYTTGCGMKLFVPMFHLQLLLSMKPKTSALTTQITGPNSTKGRMNILERRETRKVRQREEKRTREARTKMQCSTHNDLSPRRRPFVNIYSYAF